MAFTQRVKVGAFYIDDLLTANDGTEFAIQSEHVRGERRWYFLIVRRPGGVFKLVGEGSHDKRAAGRFLRAAVARWNDDLGVEAPEGLRWATGGGSAIGGCNGGHLAPDTGVAGTLCGRYGPYTPLNPRHGTRICGNCARIAKVSRVVGDDEKEPLE